LFHSIAAGWVCTANTLVGLTCSPPAGSFVNYINKIKFTAMSNGHTYADWSGELPSPALSYLMLVAVLSCWAARSANVFGRQKWVPKIQMCLQYVLIRSHGSETRACLFSNSIQLPSHSLPKPITSFLQVSFGRMQSHR